MHRTLTWIVLLTGTLGLEPAHAVTLVRDGEPAAVMVLNKDPNPVAFEAAVELQRLIERISGATLPIYFEDEWRDGKAGPRRFTTRIFVGDSETAQKAGLDLSLVGPEGYVIKTLGWFYPDRESRPHDRHPAIILAGRDEEKEIPNWAWRGGRLDRYTRGTAYAVYAFLEEELGVRWLWPGELGEVVPRMTTIDVSPADRTGDPKLSQRMFRNHTGRGYRQQAAGRIGTPFGGVWLQRELGNQSWMDHLRMGDTGELSRPGREGMGTGFAEKYGQTHPEYFAMQYDGSRLTKSMRNRIRLCLSNPQVISLAAQEAIDYFDRTPQGKVYGIELSDVYGTHCQCDVCKAWGPTISDLVARHWSAVAEIVARKHPDKLLYAHPYAEYIDSPAEVTRIHDSILLAPVGKSTTYVSYRGSSAAAVRERSRKGWLGWSKLNQQKMMWRPNYPHGFVGLPINYSRKLSEDLKLYFANKLTYTDIDMMFNQWAGDGLNYYVACKLFWDPELDYETLVHDYCDKGFGAAGPNIRAYFDALEDLYDRMAGQATNFVNHYTPEITEQLHSLLDEAVAAAADDETVKARIAFVRAAVDFAEVEHLSSLVRRPLDKKAGKKVKLTEDEIAAARAVVSERQQFIKRFIGRWELEPERIWGDWSDWVERITIAADEQAEDLWADLWEEYEEVMTLPEGGWRFAIDRGRLGLKERWFAKDYDHSGWKTIHVGNFWERQGFDGYNGLAWYRRKLVLPAALAGKRVIFSFGAADESADVYIDGELAGTRKHNPEGWDKRFELDLTDHVKPGVAQDYAIRVMDTVGMGGLWKPIKVITPRAK